MKLKNKYTRKNKHPNKKSRKGGNVIGSGGFGCVFRPALKCSKKKQRKTNNLHFFLDCSYLLPKLRNLLARSHNLGFRAAVHSERLSACVARCSATNEEEHAVSMCTTWCAAWTPASVRPAVTTRVSSPSKALSACSNSPCTVRCPGCSCQPA